MSRRIVWLIALLPLASAGTPEDPEITDPSGDGAGPKDILRFWIDDESILNAAGLPALVFHYVIASDGPDMSSLFALHERFRVGFKAEYPGAPAGTELYVYAEPNIGTTTQTGEARLICNFGVAATAGGSGQPETRVGEGAWTGTHFVCIVPYDVLGAKGGETLSGLYGQYQYVQRGPTAGSDPAGVNVATVDRAPNSGFGRDYVIPLLATEPAPLPDVYQDLEGPFLQLDQGFIEPRTQRFVWNWTTQSAEIDVRLNVTLQAGNAAVRIIDPMGDEVLACSCDGNHTAAAMRSPANGTWRIELNATDFIGNMTLNAAVPEAPSEAPPPAGDAPDTGGNETSDPGKAKDTPLGPLAVGAVAIAASLRRRRDRQR